jgi:hypothetical protein
MGIICVAERWEGRNRMRTACRKLMWCFLGDESHLDLVHAKSTLLSSYISDMIALTLTNE